MQIFNKLLNYRKHLYHLRSAIYRTPHNGGVIFSPIFKRVYSGALHFKCLRYKSSQLLFLFKLWLHKCLDESLPYNHGSLMLR